MKIAKRIIFTLLTVLVILFIFGNSAAEGEDSTELSLLVTQWINSALEFMHIPLELSHMAVRKIAHFTEFSVLGFLLTMTLWSWLKEGVRWRFGWVWMPQLGGLLAASLDEYLQTFVPERCGSIADAALDFSGVLWASLAASGIILLLQRKKVQ